MAKNNQVKQAGATAVSVAPADVAEAGNGGELAGAESNVDHASDAVAALDSATIPGERAQGTIVQARVLAFCALGSPNDVIEIDAELAATMVGIVDTAPEAVAYALSVAE